MRGAKTVGLTLFLIWIGNIAIGQESISVNGRVLVSEPINAFNLMIVNLRTQQGKFGQPDGSFQTTIRQTDTLLIALRGYRTDTICFVDSVPKSSYDLEIRPEKLSYDLRTVNVIPERDLNAIHKDISRLGYNEKDYVLSGIDAYSSPITFLYQKFSKKERSKREVAELINADNRRMLLKELFAKYVRNDIIDLSRDEFDDFIDYCKVTDEIMKYSSQYEFIMYIKEKYEQFDKLYRDDRK